MRITNEELLTNIDLDVFSAIRPILEDKDAAYLNIVAMKEGNDIRMNSHIHGDYEMLVNALVGFMVKDESVADLVADAYEIYLQETEPELLETITNILGDE